jgi:hypothetical protein
MKTLDSIRMRPKRTRVAAAVLYLAGIVAIVGWSLSQGIPAVTRDVLATRPADAGLANTRSEPSGPARVPGNARIRANCAQCGVVESIETIRRRDEVAAGCTIGDSEETHIPGSLIDAEWLTELRPLPVTIAGGIFGDRGAKKVGVTTRHRIIVRFRDGSRQVFDERPTP